MTESLRTWMEIAGIRALRVLIIVALAFLIARLLKSFTTRLVQPAKSPTRVAQMREQQPPTMAALLYSVGVGLIVAIAILTALPNFGSTCARGEAGPQE